MKKKILIKILLCLSAITGIAVLDLAGIRFLCAEQLDLKYVPVAADDIEPRTKIQDDDIRMIQVPARYLMDNAVTEKNQIVGHYTEIQGMIPKGSPFYRSMIREEQQLPDQPVLKLKEGQAVYAVTGDPATLGTLQKDMHVDLHLSLQTTEGTSITGRIVKNARILSIKDHQGLDISDQDSSGVPYLVELAVQKEDIDLLMKAEMNGEIRIFASADSYGKEEAETDEESDAVKWIRQFP